MSPSPGGPATILPPSAALAKADALAVVHRLARAQLVPEALLAALDGPLGEAVATAASYAGNALSAATKRAYARDWFHFAAWCRQQAVDPTVLPIHPVLVAAYLASLPDTSAAAPKAVGWRRSPTSTAAAAWPGTPAIRRSARPCRGWAAATASRCARPRP